MNQFASNLDAYERRIGRWSRRVARDFVGWLDLPRGQCWLDVGAGTGALTAAISAMSRPDVLVALDVSASDLQYARAQNRGGRHTLLAADALALPFASATFDAVVSGLLLNHLQTPSRAAAEMVRVLRPGGTVAGYVWDFAGQMQPLRLFWDAAIALDPSARLHDQAVKFPICRLERLMELFSAYRLGNVETRVIDVQADYQHFADLWDPLVAGIGSLPDYVRSLSHERLLSLRERLRQSAPAGPDGRIRLIARALAVRARVA